jgi:tRNA(Ile)-lysidine synthetase-like protein
VVPNGPHQKWNEKRFSDVLHFVDEAPAGKRWPMPGGGWVESERDSIVLRGALVDAFEGRWSRPEACELLVEALPALDGGVSFGEDEAAYLDADRVCPPFTLRKVRPGDRMQPLGMRGHKKLAKLFAERAIPRPERPHRWVVEDQERILWAVGITPCEEARIRPDTQRVLRIRVAPRSERIVLHERTST